MLAWQCALSSCCQWKYDGCAGFFQKSSQPALKRSVRDGQLSSFGVQDRLDEYRYATGQNQTMLTWQCAQLSCSFCKPDRNFGTGNSLQYCFD